MKNFKILALASAILVNNNIAFADNAEDRYVYIGSEIGFSEPVVKSFVHKSSAGETKMRLKQSRMYGGRVGYSFYPNMSVEISATHQPKYRLAYRLPAVDLTSTFQRGIIAEAQANGYSLEEAQGLAKATLPSAGIPSTPDVTAISSNVVTLNLVYEFEKQKFGLKPYVIFGGGLAQIKLSDKTTSWQPSENLSDFVGTDPIDFFKVRKKMNNCFTYQFGGGISKDVTQNFSVDLGAKLQVVKDIKIEYSKLDMTKKDYVKQEPIKKTIGVGEFTVGFTFKIPVK